MAAKRSRRLSVQAFSETRAAPPCVFVLFGATGDLTARKIAPALYNLYRDGLLSENTYVLGVARRPRSDEVFREEMLAGLQRYSRSQPIDMDVWQRFSRNWGYHITHADAPDEYASLDQRLRDIDEKCGTGGSRVFYLAMTPDVVPEIVDNLESVGLHTPAQDGGFVRLVVEKPFGHDLASAQALNDAIHQAFDEQQVYRIDHYMGKETVQNMLVFRFANTVFEPLLNRHYVDNIQITAAETVGMEGRRGPYYEGVGALRDMIQNHLLQVMSLVAMEPPARMTAEAIRDEKAKLLRAIRQPSAGEIAESTVRGQYRGDADDNYRNETGVAPDSEVETFAALRLHVDNWRWAGVPFYLRTGKRLARKVAEVVVVFKRNPLNLFQADFCDLGGPNHLHIRIQPNEGISMAFDAKVPGTAMLLRPVKMDFGYETSFASASPEGYEHLLLDAMRGEPTLFIRGDEVEASWRIADAVRNGWARRGRPELQFYAPGSWGPDTADTLFEDPYQRWHPL